jgi:hypothetical protein
MSYLRMAPNVRELPKGRRVTVPYADIDRQRAYNREWARRQRGLTLRQRAERSEERVQLLETAATKLAAQLTGMIYLNEVRPRRTAVKLSKALDDFFDSFLYDVETPESGQE